jgi:hypothetical protein
MKKITNIIICIAILLSLMFTSCLHLFAQEIKGNGKLTTKSIPISDFSKIEIETFVEIDYSQDKNTGKLEFTIDDNLWEYYDIYTKNNVLHVKLKDQYRNKSRLNPTKNLITVSSEQLKEIEIAGSSKFNFCTSFASNKLNIEIAGSGKVFADKHPVKIQECNIEIAGSGSVNLAGAIRDVAIEIAGSGNVNALDCKMTHLQADIAGSGNVEAYVTETLTANIAGSGKVKYKGDPSTINPNVTGSGKIMKL